MAFKPMKQPPHPDLVYTTGNIVNDKAEVLVNTVNAQLSPSGNGVMGAGVAKAFKERYPSIMKDYEAAIRSGELTAGRALLFDLPDGRKWAALATKDDWKDQSQPQWVDSGLKELGEKLRENGLKSVAITPPGCGNGGLNWKDIEPMVHKHLHGVSVSMYGKPSGAMREGYEKTSLSSLSEDHEKDMPRLFQGKLAQKPEVLFGSAVDGESLKIILYVQEPGRQAVPVTLTTPKMPEGVDTQEAKFRMADEFQSLRVGDDVSVGGKWGKLGNDWNFSAKRVAKGKVALESLKADKPSPSIVGDILIEKIREERLQAGTAPEQSVKQDRSAPARIFSVNEQTPVQEKATMYFDYNRDRRPGVQSTSTFDAILDAERTSTTRFPQWGNIQKWENLKEGDKVRFFDDKEMRGRSVVVTVGEVKKVDFRTMSDQQKDEWSKAEGWSKEHATALGNRYGAGVQIRYRPTEGQEILEGRKSMLPQNIALAKEAIKPGAQVDASPKPSQAVKSGMAAMLGQSLGG